MRAAAVTGWALRASLGSSPEAVQAALLEGRSAARPSFDRGRLGAPLTEMPPVAPSHRRFLTPFASLCVKTAVEASRHAGCAGGPRLALFAAVGGLRVAWQETLPVFRKIAPEGDGAWDAGLRELHPFWLLKHLSNNAHALASVELGARGEGATYGGANGGAQALVAALRCLEDGACDAAIVMAGDSLLAPEALVELEGAGYLTRASVEDLLPPYDAGAAGFVPGEATAALVLEPADKAAGRALALVSAAAGADPGFGPPSVKLLRRLTEEIGSDAALVDGAGFARAELDLAEREAASSVVGPQAPLTCCAAALGQTGAAHPLIQIVALAGALRGKTAYPIAGLREPAAGPLRPVKFPEPVRGRVALGLCAGAPGLAGAVRVEVP